MGEEVQKDDNKGLSSLKYSDLSVAIFGCDAEHFHFWVLL
jgi:hypothetical protein